MKALYPFATLRIWTKNPKYVHCHLRRAVEAFHLATATIWAVPMVTATLHRFPARVIVPYVTALVLKALWR
jgi:hypothetical protein